MRFKDNRVDVGMMQSGLGGNPFDLMHESYVFYEEYSAKQDHINAKFSAVQNAVRKEAVKTILKSRGGWVGRFVAKALDDFVANVTEVARDHTPDSVGTWCCWSLRSIFCYFFLARSFVYLFAP